MNHPELFDKPLSYAHYTEMLRITRSMTWDDASQYLLSQAAAARKIAADVHRRRAAGDFASANLLLQACNAGIRHHVTHVLEHYLRQAPAPVEEKAQEPEAPDTPLLSTDEDDEDYVPGTPASVPETAIQDLDQFHELNQPGEGPPSVDFGPVAAAREPEPLQLEAAPLPLVQQEAPRTPVRRSPRFAGPVTRQTARHRAAKRQAGSRLDRDDNRATRRRL